MSDKGSKKLFSSVLIGLLLLMLTYIGFAGHVLPNLAPANGSNVSGSILLFVNSTVNATGNNGNLINATWYYRLNNTVDLTDAPNAVPNNMFFTGGWALIGASNFTNIPNGASNQSNLTWATTAVGDGFYELNTTVNNGTLGGDTASIKVNITIDNSAPNVSYHGNSATGVEARTVYLDQPGATEWIFVNVTAFEYFRHFNATEFTLRNGTTTNTQTYTVADNFTRGAILYANTSNNYTGLADGTYNYSVRTTDGNGNANTTGTVIVVVDTTRPTCAVTTDDADNSVLIGQRITVTCTATDTNPYLVSSTWLGTTKQCEGGSSSCAQTLTASAAGTQTATCVARDRVYYDDNSTATKGDHEGTCSLNIIVGVAEGSDSGGSGGSGGGGSSSSTSLTDVQADEPNTVNVGTNSVSTIDFKVVSAVTNADINVEETSSAPSSVTVPSGYVSPFVYLEITSSNLEDSNLKEARINFKVTKSWLTSNNLEKRDVVLLRNVNGNWRELSTSVLTEDSESVSYEALTPGFSVFAISAKQQDVTAAPGSDTGSDVAGGEVDGTTGEPGKSNSALVWIVVIIIIAVLLLVWYFVKKGNNPPHLKGK